MRNYNQIWICFLVVCMLTAIIPSGSVTAAGAVQAQMTLSIPAGELRQGETFQVELKALQITDLDALQFTLEYDTAVMQYGGIAIEDQFTVFGGQVEDQTSGRISYPLINMEPSSRQEASIVVAALTFTSVQAGTAVFKLTNVKAVNGQSKMIPVAVDPAKQVTIQERETRVPHVPVGSVSILEERVELHTVQRPTQVLTATIAPSNATNRNISWSSSDPSIATVDTGGKVTGLKAGQALITARAVDGGAEDTSTVQVMEPAAEIRVTGVRLDVNEVSMNHSNAKERQLTATVFPANATNQGLVWSSSDRSVAMVDESGTVKAVADGQAVITVTTLDGGFTAESLISVSQPPIQVRVASVRLNVQEAALKVGEESTVTADIQPVDATNQSVEWTSSNSDIVSVNQAGKLRAIKEGQAVVSVTTVDGGKRAEVKVVVTAAPAVPPPPPPPGGGFIPPMPQAPAAPEKKADHPADQPKLVERKVPSDHLTAELKMNEKGQSFITAKVDAAKLEGFIQEQLSSEASAQSQTKVTMQVEGAGAQVQLELQAATFAKMTGLQKNSLMEIQSSVGSMTIPAAPLLQVLEREGISADRTPLTFTMTKADAAEEKAINERIESMGGKVMVTPVDFKIEAVTPQGNVEVNRFSAYVSRTMELPSSAMDNSVDQLAGVLMDPAGNSFYPVPALFTMDSKGMKAQLFRKGNSVYTVTHHQKSFNDVPAGHYAKQSIERLASKFIVSGYDDNTFLPARQVTRAEFSTLLIRALGVLPEAAGIVEIKDVASSQWFAGSVGAAMNSGFVAGYEDGTFRPDKQISRAEMTVMITNAMKESGYSIEMTEEEALALLAPYADLKEVPSWALIPMAAAVKEGIITGLDDTRLAPGATADRAQSAVILSRMLKTLGFMN